MSREWKPGDVALVIGKNIATPRIGIKDTHGWVVINQGGDRLLHAQRVKPACVAPIRPLVVIDPEDRGAVLRLMGHYSRADHDGMVDAMQAALREFADPKPPKPEEPMGLGAVVEDAGGEKWVSVLNDRGIVVWVLSGGGNTFRQWFSIDAVKVLSEGVR